jgi:hypothetical protein
LRIAGGGAIPSPIAARRSDLAVELSRAIDAASAAAPLDGLPQGTPNGRSQTSMPKTASSGAAQVINQCQLRTSHETAKTRNQL